MLVSLYWEMTSQSSLSISGPVLPRKFAISSSLSKFVPQVPCWVQVKWLWNPRNHLDLVVFLQGIHALCHMVPCIIVLEQSHAAWGLLHKRNCVELQNLMYYFACIQVVIDQPQRSVSVTYILAKTMILAPPHAPVVHIGYQKSFSLCPALCQSVQH